MSERRQLAGRYNALRAIHGPDAPETIAAARDLRVLQLEQHIRRIADEAPPLTDLQRARLAEILLPSRKSAR